MKRLFWPLLLGAMAYGVYKFIPDLRRELKMYSM